MEGHEFPRVSLPPRSLGIDGLWIGIHDGDPRAIPIYRRHYSAKLRKGSTNREGFVGPGEKMVLITVLCDALFVWHQAEAAMRGDLQEGISCSIFRNEGTILSSLLILEADELAFQRWPGKRHFTYVWDAKIQSVNPGYCFKKAGWESVGRNKDGRLTMLEKRQS